MGRSTPITSPTWVPGTIGWAALHMTVESGAESVDESDCAIVQGCLIRTCRTGRRGKQDR